jgi:hypothetical protein
MLPAKLSKELGDLRARYTVEVLEEPDFVNAIISGFPTGEGYNSETTTVLLRVPRAYPDAGMDMFWTAVELTLADGRIPQAAESIETYVGRPWRRFSWHHNGWPPATQSLPAYLEFVRRRFRAH